MKSLSSLAGTGSLDPIKIKKCRDKTGWIKRKKTINQPDQGWCWSSTPFLGFALNHPFPSPLGFQVSNQHHCWFGQRCHTDHAEYLQRYPHCSCFWFDSTRTNQRTVKLKRLCLKNVKYPTLVFCTPMRILSDVDTQPLRRILYLKFGHKHTAILEICNKIYILYRSLGTLGTNTCAGFVPFGNVW